MRLFKHSTSRIICLNVISFLTCISMTAQIGYQVTILDTATGEPRANETITATISISDAAGGTICSDVKTATTDEFGVLSLEVGNSGTFANVDWSKLPLYISATVDGVMIGRTQVLSVPIAEHAKHSGSLTKEILCSKSWTCTQTFGMGTVRHCSISFTTSGSYSWRGGEYSGGGRYQICGNSVVCKDSDGFSGLICIYSDVLDGLAVAGDNVMGGYFFD